MNPVTARQFDAIPFGKAESAAGKTYCCRGRQSELKFRLMSLSQIDSTTVSSGAGLATDLNYALVMRAIGQDLSQFFPRVLEIEADGTTFEAQGESHPNPFEVVQEGMISKAWNKLRGIRPPAPIVPASAFKRRYGPSEIEQIDRMNRAHRSDNFRRADIYSLPERLRTMGSIVDNKKGRLKHLRKEADRLVVEYWDQLGQLQSAKLTTVILYRNQQRLDQKRRNGPPELWEGYDF